MPAWVILAGFGVFIFGCLFMIGWLASIPEVCGCAYGWCNCETRLKDVPVDLLSDGQIAVLCAKEIDKKWFIKLLKEQKRRSEADIHKLDEQRQTEA